MKASPNRGSSAPRNSSRPPPRTQAATLKRNKKATWHPCPHSLRFLRRSHGISMLSLSFVSTPLHASQADTSDCSTTEVHTQSPGRKLARNCEAISKTHKAAQVKCDPPVCCYVNVSSPQCYFRKLLRNCVKMCQFQQLVDNHLVSHSLEMV